MNALVSTGVALILIAATAASAAVREPEITMTARRIMGSLQITAIVRPGYKFPPGQINLIQVGTALPERPISYMMRECTWMVSPPPATWTVGLVMTDKNRTRVWQSYYKGTVNPLSEYATVQAVDTGPVIPDSGIIQRPPVLPPLSDVKDADRLPEAVRSERGGKWRDVGITTGGAGMGDAPAGLPVSYGSRRTSAAPATPETPAQAPARAPANLPAKQRVKSSALAPSEAVAPAGAPAGTETAPEAASEAAREAAPPAVAPAAPAATTSATAATAATVTAAPVVVASPSPAPAPVQAAPVADTAAPATTPPARSENARRLIDALKTRNK